MADETIWFGLKILEFTGSSVTAFFFGYGDGDGVGYIERPIKHQGCDSMRVRLCEITEIIESVLLKSGCWWGMHVCSWLELSGIPSAGYGWEIRRSTYCWKFSSAALTRS